MTVGLITVESNTPVKELAQLIIGARIGGLPVLDGDRLVGIVTSTDLLANEPSLAARTARDVMTTNPVTLTEDMTVSGAARVLQKNKIKRAPVMRGERLVGLVTRADLLRPYLRTDSEIRAEVENDVLVRALGLSPREFQVRVENGVVSLEGVLPNEHVHSLFLRLVRSVAGAVDVLDRLTVTDGVPALADGRP